MLFNGFVVNENVVPTLKQYNALYHGKELHWGMKRLSVYRNPNTRATIDVNPNGTKYMVTCIHTDGHTSTSTFFTLETAEEYVNYIVNGFYAHSNNVMGIEINFKSRYSY